MPEPQPASGRTGQPPPGGDGARDLDLYDDLLRHGASEEKAARITRAVDAVVAADRDRRGPPGAAASEGATSGAAASEAGASSPPQPGSHPPSLTHPTPLTGFGGVPG